MSNPLSPMQVFESSLGMPLSLADSSNHDPSEPVDAFIQETLRVAQFLALEKESRCNEPGKAPEADVWDEVGAFMLRTSAIMANFTVRVKDADLVEKAAQEKFRKAKKHNHLASMSVLQSLDDKKKMFQ